MINIKVYYIIYLKIFEIATADPELFKFIMIGTMVWNAVNEN